MKVAILQNSFWSEGGSTSGGDELVWELFNFEKKVAEIHTWYSSKRGCSLAKLKIKNIQCYITDVGLFKKNIYISYAISTFLAIIKLVFKKYDVIYASSDFFPDVIPSFIYRITHERSRWIQCIFHIYPYWRVRPGSIIKNLIGEYSQKLSLMMIKKSDCVHVINHEVRDYLIKIGFNAEKISLIPPGINLSRIQGLSLSDARKYEGVFLGRLKDSKGIFDLPKIWKVVTDNLPEARLAIIGGGSPETINKLNLEFSKLKLENNIFILGSLETDDIYKILSVSKVFVFPSHEEGFGIAIAEALASGLEVVCWNLHVYDLIYKDQVTKIPKFDFQLFGEAVSAILRVDRTKNVAGTEFIKKYDWLNIKNHFISLLRG